MADSPPPIRFLFRYRDLVAETLVEHRDVLKTHKRVWWGWWKRPTEDPRASVWQALGEAIAKNKQVRVGLFDSGQASPTKAVTCAWIDAVVPPTTSTGSSSSAVALPATEDQKLVPRYYRSQPFSRAWMRIIAFEDDPLEFFGAYSYALPPPLDKHPQSLLERLAKKRVMDPLELRSMDTTIWEVRPRNEGDEDWHFLAAPFTVGKAHSSSPIRARGPLILHISDPHFTAAKPFDWVKEEKFEKYRMNHVWQLENEGSNTLSSTLGESLGAKKNDIGCIVVTGDLTYMAHPLEFLEAHRFLGRLLGILDLSADNLVVIPGNHDLS